MRRAARATISSFSRRIRYPPKGYAETGKFLRHNESADTGYWAAFFICPKRVWKIKSFLLAASVRESESGATFGPARFTLQIYWRVRECPVRTLLAPPSSVTHSPPSWLQHMRVFLSHCLFIINNKTYFDKLEKWNCYSKWKLGPQLVLPY